MNSFTRSILGFIKMLHFPILAIIIILFFRSYSTILQLPALTLAIFLSLSSCFRIVYPIFHPILRKAFPYIFAFFGVCCLVINGASNLPRTCIYFFFLCISFFKYLTFDPFVGYIFLMIATSIEYASYIGEPLPSFCFGFALWFCDRFIAPTTFALIGAGSIFIEDYGDQADALAFYETLLHRGFRRWQIELMISSEIISDSRFNKFPNKMFHLPHKNVFHWWTNISYCKEKCSASHFLNLIRKVRTTKYDRFLVFFTDHGDRNALCFPADVVLKQELANILKLLLDQQAFKEILFIFDCCFSGDFLNVMKSKKVFIITAGSPKKEVYHTCNHVPLGFPLSSLFMRRLIYFLEKNSLNYVQNLASSISRSIRSHVRTNSYFAKDVPLIELYLFFGFYCRVFGLPGGNSQYWEDEIRETRKSSVSANRELILKKIVHLSNSSKDLWEFCEEATFDPLDVYENDTSEVAQYFRNIVGQQQALYLPFASVFAKLLSAEVPKANIIQAIDKAFCATSNDE